MSTLIYIYEKYIKSYPFYSISVMCQSTNKYCIMETLKLLMCEVSSTNTKKKVKKKKKKSRNAWIYRVPKTIEKKEDEKRITQKKKKNKKSNQ